MKCFNQIYIVNPKTMVIITVAYVYGWLFTCMAAAMIVPLIFAFFLNETAQVQSFLITSIGTIFIGGALILALKNEPHDTGRKQGLLLLATIWFILPLIAALPFYFSKTPYNFLQAYFEAVSGFTTTGATIFVDVSELPKSILVWRALLQWIGGLVTLLILAAILAPVIAADDLEGDFRQTKHATGGGKQQISQALPIILPIYSFLTISCFFLLVISKIPIFDAFCLSFSTVSTGGFMPRPGDIALYGSPLAELVLSFFMFLGAVNIIWVNSICQGRMQLLKQFREPIWIATAIITIGFLLAITLAIKSPEKNFSAFYHSLTLGLLTASSFISTTGFQVSTQTKELIPYIIIIVLCLIGGGRLSTAGGLKFFRIVAMFSHSFRELVQLLFPHGVRPANLTSYNMDSMIMRSVWANFTLIIFAICMLTVIISLTGLPFSAALLASVSAISNIGSAYNLTSLPELTIAQSYTAMHPGAHAALCFGMILGRVEVLALLSIFNMSYWKS